ncbi:hypothetical protein CYMTET_55549 [Cymbomonas tetramitiformis]|uniref:Uncharacterized protein n=1 Tax=Cymbomonas tetramitiformis TaxID=36881 RepID=A0AAE0EN89_9CHLO|nr:hypothetical protein CYMTET_55549 [Cymbomonas tetramitiformis]
MAMTNILSEACTATIPLVRNQKHCCQNRVKVLGLKSRQVRSRQAVVPTRRSNIGRLNCKAVKFEERKVNTTMQSFEEERQEMQSNDATKAAISLAMLSVLASPAAFAVEEEVTVGGMDPTTYVIALFPVILYGIFTLYRLNFNRNIKIVDFMFGVFCFFIFGNIFSILIFKTRLY